MNKLDYIKNLKTLSNLSGIPGNEKRVASYIMNNLENDVAIIKNDRLGSLLTIKNQEIKGYNVLIGAHMDEVGLMVTEITKEGYIKFQTIGGWFSQVMLAQVWQITTSKGIILGVTGCKPPHLIPLSERSTAITVDKMFLDIGVKSSEEAIAAGIKIGDMITPYIEACELTNKDYVLGKAWDDRVGCGVVMDVLKNYNNQLDYNLIGAFTTQEEVGLRGASTLGYLSSPDIVIAIDSGVGYDTPGGIPKEQTLGCGPQILCYDAGLIPHQGLRNFIIEVCKKYEIKYQETYITAGRTDAGAFHLTKQGAAAISICIPTRYMHSHTSIISKTDYLETVKLINAILTELNNQKIEGILSR